MSQAVHHRVRIGTDLGDDLGHLAMVARAGLCPTDGRRSASATRRIVGAALRCRLQLAASCTVIGTE